MHSLNHGSVEGEAGLVGRQMKEEEEVEAGEVRRTMALVEGGVHWIEVMVVGGERWNVAAAVEEVHYLSLVVAGQDEKKLGVKEGHSKTELKESWEVMVAEEYLLEEQHVHDHEPAAPRCLMREVEGVEQGLVLAF